MKGNENIIKLCEEERLNNPLFQDEEGQRIMDILIKVLEDGYSPEQIKKLCECINETEAAEYAKNTSPLFA